MNVQGRPGMVPFVRSISVRAPNRRASFRHSTPSVVATVIVSIYTGRRVALVRVIHCKNIDPLVSLAYEASGEPPPTQVELFCGYMERDGKLATGQIHVDAGDWLDVEILEGPDEIEVTINGLHEGSILA
jgi:hypothetical protein